MPPPAVVGTGIHWVDEATCFVTVSHLLAAHASPHSMMTAERHTPSIAASTDCCRQACQSSSADPRLSRFDVPGP
eukprot:scaffold7452_cov315-Pinguiococcus_pyrenoidosus.AAC.1